MRTTKCPGPATDGCPWHAMPAGFVCARCGNGRAGRWSGRPDKNEKRFMPATTWRRVQKEKVAP